MAKEKRFELKLFRVVPSLQFCRPNDRSVWNSIHRLPSSSVNSRAFPLPSPPPSTPVFPVDISSEISASFTSCTMSYPAKANGKHHNRNESTDDLIFKSPPMLKPRSNHVLLSSTRLKGKKEKSSSKVMTPAGSLVRAGEGFMAVEKSSKEPYEDFKRSMMEMIVEKEIFEMKDLEELLHCFLSLNSRHYHGVIIMAFSEIWDVLCSVSRNGRK